jgi:hypothetical protein
VAEIISPDIATIALGSPVPRPQMGFEQPEPGSVAAVAGTYQMPDDFASPALKVTLMDRGDYLEADWSNGTTSVVYPTLDGDFVDRNAWAKVHFTRDEQGKVTGFQYRLSRTFNARRIQH